MIAAFFYGLGTGMIMSIMLGTVFFALIQNSIDNGFKSGMYISLGVILSDVILISITYFNSTLIPEGGTTEQIVRICGAIFLLIYGISNLLNKKKIAYPKTGKGQILYFMGIGFLLNILNPGNFIGWTVVSTSLSQVAQYSNFDTILYYVGALSAIFGMETLISYGAVQLKRFVTLKFLMMVDRVVGVLFLIFAVVLVWPMVK